MSRVKYEDGSEARVGHRVIYNNQVGAIVVLIRFDNGALLLLSDSDVRLVRDNDTALINEPACKAEKVPFTRDRVADPIARNYVQSLWSTPVSGPEMHGIAFRYSYIALRSPSSKLWKKGQGMTCSRSPLNGCVVPKQG